MNPETPNKTDAGNGSYGICRVSNVSRSPSPDPSQTPSLPAADPRSDRFRCAGRESKFLAAKANS
jgi:hypothetical protein